MLRFFMQKFCAIIKTMDSTYKELSIAIRGYGFFAAVCSFSVTEMFLSKRELYVCISVCLYHLFFTLQPCKKICQSDVDLMYTELIQRCKIMYLTESDGDEEDRFYQLPSFLDSIASILIHLDKVAYCHIMYSNRHGCTISPAYLQVSAFLFFPFFQIPEVYTPVLERLLVVQLDSFPQYSEKMQSTCCRSILKVLLAMTSKGPVLWGFISSVGMFTIMWSHTRPGVSKLFEM